MSDFALTVASPKVLMPVLTFGHELATATGAALMTIVRPLGLTNTAKPMTQDRERRFLESVHFLSS